MNFEPKHKKLEVEIRGAASHERGLIVDFYRGLGYDYAAMPSDHLVVAIREMNIVGVARLAAEGGILVLRGVRVAPECQRSGIGSELIKACVHALKGRECWCIPFAHLEGFYGKEGFLKTEIAEAPAVIRTRVEGFIAEGRSDLIVMRRPSSSYGKYR